jgi:thiol:disulfide interchange protein
MQRLLTLVAVLAFAATAAAADPPAKFDPARDPAQDVAAAVATAKAQGKRVLVDVGGEWCSWCHILDRFVEANADVQALRDRSYVWVKVNWSNENKNEAFLARWPSIKGYPHLFVLDADGKLVHSQDTGQLESGKSYDRAKMIAFLTQWAPPN